MALFGKKKPEPNSEPLPPVEEAPQPQSDSMDFEDILAEIRARRAAQAGGGTALAPLSARDILKDGGKPLRPLPARKPMPETEAERLPAEQPASETEEERLPTEQPAAEIELQLLSDKAAQPPRPSGKTAVDPARYTASRMAAIMETRRRSAAARRAEQTDEESAAPPEGGASRPEGEPRPEKPEKAGRADDFDWPEEPVELAEGFGWHDGKAAPEDTPAGVETAIAPEADGGAPRESEPEPETMSAGHDEAAEEPEPEEESDPKAVRAAERRRRREQKSAERAARRRKKGREEPEAADDGAQPEGRPETEADGPSPEELAEQKRRRAEEEAAERAAERRRRRELREAERKNRPKLFTPGMPARRRRYMLSRVIFATAFLVVSTVLLGIVVWVFYVSRVFGTVIDWLLIGLCVPAFAAMLFVYARYLATLNYEYDAHYVD